MQVILYNPHNSENSQQTPLKAKKEISFDELEQYFTKLLDYAPVMKNIEDEVARKIFTEFIAKTLSFQGKTIKSKAKMEDGNNIAKTLFCHCNNVLSAIPLAIENGVKKTPRKKNSFLLSNFKIKRDNPMITNALDKIETDCKNLEKTGNDMENYIKIYDEIDDILKVINDVKELLKVSNNEAESDELITRGLFDFEQAFNETENNINLERNKYLENQKSISSLEGNIHLNGKRLEDCKKNEQEFTEQIEKMNKEIEVIKSSKKKINENFDKSRENIISKHESKLADDLKNKAILNAKINEEQQKVMSDLKAAITIREQKVNYIIIIDRSGSMCSQIAQVNTAAQNFLNELKKTNNSNFYFSVVYFDHNAITTADTLPMSSVSNFSQYLNMNASGGTSYSAGLSQVYNLVSRNIKSKIDRVSMVFFTDGCDGDVFQIHII